MTAVTVCLAFVVFFTVTLIATRDMPRSVRESCRRGGLPFTPAELAKFAKPSQPPKGPGGHPSDGAA